MCGSTMCYPLWRGAADFAPRFRGFRAVSRIPQGVSRLTAAAPRDVVVQAVKLARSSSLTGLGEVYVLVG